MGNLGNEKECSLESVKSTSRPWLSHAVQICQSISFGLCGGCIGGISFFLMDPMHPMGLVFPLIITMFGVAAGIGLSLPFVSGANVLEGFMSGLVPEPVKLIYMLFDQQNEPAESDPQGIYPVGKEWEQYLLQKVDALTREQPVDFSLVVTVVDETLQQNGFFEGRDRVYRKCKVWIATLQVMKQAYSMGCQIHWYDENKCETEPWANLIERIGLRWPIGSDEPPPYALFSLSRTNSTTKE